MKKVLIALVLCIPSWALACINVKGTRLDGGVSEHGGASALYELRHSYAITRMDDTFTTRFSRDQWEVSNEEGEAVQKILAGDFDSAIAALTKIEAATPGTYSTAANLGTAYELKGDDANALKWISTGIARNPDSHHQTEWLHVLILEAKLEAAKHPDHPLVGHLINIPDRFDRETEITVQGKAYNVFEVYIALVYQLKERLVFVKPKDPFVADLLVSLAVIESNLYGVESAQGLLKMARDYGFPDEALLARHEKRFEQAIQKRQFKEWSAITLGIVILVVFFYQCYRRKWIYFSRKGSIAPTAT